MNGSSATRGPGDSEEPEGGVPDQWPAPTIASVPIGPGMASVAPVVIPKRRLHPLTPLLESFRLIIAVVVASSWQMYLQENFRVGVVVAVLAGAVGAVSGLLSWRFTGYRVVGGELQITEGVLIRKSRTLPLERLQGIEVAQPLRARVFGLAQLRIEVAGASETEAPLSYLKLDEAQRLREDLLGLSGRSGPTDGEETETAAEGGETAADAEKGTPIARVGAARLIAGAVLESLPPTVIAVGLLVGLGALLNTVLNSQGVESEVWQAAGVPFLFGLLTSVLQTGAGVLRNWGFTLSRSEGRLRVERGLTEKHSNVVPLGRVTAVSVQTPVMWRLKGWRRVQVSTASIAQQGTEGLVHGNALLPVGAVADAELVAGTALPGISWPAVTATLERPPRRARWRTPLTWRLRGAGLGDDVFAVRYGLVKTVTVAVPYARIQQVEVTQGPLQRAQRLATVRARIAGSVSHDAVAIHRDAAEAVELAAELRERADTAAAAEEPRLS